LLTKNHHPKHIDFSTGEVLLMDKEKGISTFTIIRQIKRIVKIKKIGHAGTLDPMATGLVILCTGKMTKQIQDYQALYKVYEGEITLGAITPSYDAETEVSESFPFDHLSDEEVKATAQKFEGKMMQKPPIYSALKVGGERLYKKARKGEIVEIKSRPVEIYYFKIKHIKLPRIDFEVKCSKGTYIRSLANDFGQALGCGGYLSSLRRISIGEYHVDNALTIKEFDNILLNAKELII
jgi:tRNA pseudouridine55 synthase